MVEYLVVSIIIWVASVCLGGRVCPLIVLMSSPNSFHILCGINLAQL